MSELEQEEEATDFLAFATLGLDSDLEDEPQSSSSSTQANGKLNREQRLQRAFQTSKDTWRAEHGLTESGWYIGLGEHPYDTDTRPLQFVNPETDGATSSPSPSRISGLDVKLLEYDIAQKYLNRQYPSCLSRCLDYLYLDSQNPGNRTATPPSEGSGVGGRYDDVELPVLGNPQKEILDVALRCSAKAQDKKSAKKLVQSSRGFWKVSGNAGIAESAAIASLVAGEHIDAIIAIFHSIADRSLLLPYVRMVTQILQTWPKDEPRGASTQTFEYRAGLLETFNKILAWMNSDTSSLLDPVSSIEEQADWTVEALGLTKEHEALAIRVWQRIEKSKLVLINAKSGEGGELDTGRSVRTL